MFSGISTKISDQCSALKAQCSCGPMTPEKVLKVAAIIFTLAAVVVATTALATNFSSSHDIFYTLGGIAGGASLTLLLIIGLPKLIASCKSHQG